MDVQEIIETLRAKGRPEYLAVMRRFCIDPSGALGVKIPELRSLAKKIKKDHTLALGLWETGIHEARILASMIDDPELVTVRQINRWVKDFRSWDVCDQVCGNLLDRTPYAVASAVKFSGRKEEFVKRAGFVLMAEYAVHDRTAKDAVFISFLPLIEKAASDDRNFVKKAVNWALRQIGKRNNTLLGHARACAERISRQPYSSARWIARDALREFDAMAR